MNLDTLESLAKAATPGPWSCFTWSNGVSYVRGGPYMNSITTAENNKLPDHYFIAAANPATILAMIALLRQAKEALELEANIYMQDNEDGPPETIMDVLTKYKEMTK